MASGDTQEPGLLHEKLKDQVALSIKESLEKATSVLSNLHRLQSYLDVIKTVSPSRSHGNEGIKSALEQVRAVRADAATLLQTVYLTEIALQSLQDFDKSGSGSLSSIMPILGDATGIDIGSGQAGGGDMMVGISSADEMAFVDNSTAAESIDGMIPPPPKKMNLGVVISTCSTCSKKFATQRSNDGHPAICKNCRPTKQPPAITTTSTPPVVTPILSSTPIKSKKLDSSASGGKRGNLPPLLCKLCGVCFLYRRCLLRHLKETHSNVDVNNLHRYIDIGSKTILEKTNTSQESQTSSLNVTVGSDITACDPDLGMDTTGPATAGIHLHIPEVSGGSLQGDIGHQDLLEGAIATKATSNENDQNDKKAKSYVCSICNKTFDRPYRLQRHIQIHDPNRPRVTCQICDRSFTRYDTLENHMKCLHSDERPFKCSAEACMKAFPTQSALMHHLRTHMDGKPYKCFECDSSFALLNEYKQHMRDAHPDTQGLRCSDCYRLFPDNHSLEEHKQLEHRVECEICGKTFARLAYLQTHAEVHNGDSLFNCKYCNSGFDTEYSYKQHIKIHPEFHRSKKVYQCQLCDKTYQQPSDLVEHYRSQEHRDKANSIGLGGSILNTIEGDLSDVSVLMDEVAMGTNEDGSIIQSLTEGNEFQPTSVATSFSGTSVSGQDTAFVTPSTFVGTSDPGQDAAFTAPSTSNT